MTGPFRVNDIVGVEHLGRGFLAIITGEDGANLEVQPLPKNVTYYHIPKSHVKTMWRLSKGVTPEFRGNCGLIYG